MLILNLEYLSGKVSSLVDPAMLVVLQLPMLPSKGCCDTLYEALLNFLLLPQRPNAHFSFQGLLINRFWVSTNNSWCTLMCFDGSWSGYGRRKLTVMCCAGRVSKSINTIYLSMKPRSVRISGVEMIRIQVEFVNRFWCSKRARCSLF